MHRTGGSRGDAHLVSAAPSAGFCHLTLCYSWAATATTCPDALLFKNIFILKRYSCRTRDKRAQVLQSWKEQNSIGCPVLLHCLAGCNAKGKGTTKLFSKRRCQHDPPATQTAMAKTPPAKPQPEPLGPQEEKQHQGHCTVLPSALSQGHLNTMLPRLVPN